MTMITIPAGRTIREIAERLGVPTEELQKHAKASDVETPMVQPTSFDVPDELLRARERTRRQEKQQTFTPTSGRMGGMNAWLAMDIEQKRTRTDGGMHAQEATPDEREGFAEALRTYNRFDAASNELAVTLFAQLTSSKSIAMRAEAHAWCAIAVAHGHLLFATPAKTARNQSLSAAKAALLADPKLPEAHLAMALALRVDGGENDRREAMEELLSALRVAPEHHSCWLAVAELHLDAGETDAAFEACEKARAADEPNAPALELAGRIALARGDTASAERLWQGAREALPTFATPIMRLAVVRKGAGNETEAAALSEEALQAATNAAHRARLQESWDRG